MEIQKSLLFLFIILMIGLVGAETTICIDFDPPSPPSNLAVSGEVGNILLTWDASTDVPDCSGIAEYIISRDGNEIGVVNGGILNFIDSDSLEVGKYNYTVYAVDMVGHHKSDSVVNEIIIKVVEDTKIVSSGGGGSSYTPTQTHLKTYPVSNQELKTGFSKTLEKNDKITFQFNDESHSLTISNIEHNKVEIIVSSTPQYAVLGEGESKNFDLNDNNVSDLMVTVESINNTLTEIKIQSLYEDSNDEITIDNTASSDETSNPSTTGTGAVIGAIGTNAGITIIIFIVLAVGGFVAVRVRKKS